MKGKQGLNFSWLLRMAWRDSRRNRSRLLLFISSIILGIAALVAIYSLGDNMRDEIDRQAAALLGADLELSTNRQPSDAVKLLADSLGDERSEERSFTSMVLFPKNMGTRLVQVRALSGGFPYYGDLETSPTSAARMFRKDRFALIDQTLMLQFNARVGDSIHVGNLSFLIAGSLISAPGQTGLSASVAPIVYIPLRYLPQTGLSQKGSRINYKFYYRFKSGVNAESVVKKIKPQLEKEGVNYETVQSQKEDTSRSLKDLTQFLALISFINMPSICLP